MIVLHASVILMGMAVLAGCASHDGEATPEVDADKVLVAAETVEQTIIYQGEDGILTSRTVHVPLASFKAELQRKIELTAAAERGETLPPRRTQPSVDSPLELEDASSSNLQYYYGDVSSQCYGEDMWLSSTTTGNYVPSNTLCFKKHPGGTGYTDLYIFYMPAGAGCMSTSEVAYCTNSWWSGADSGRFFRPAGGGGAPVFTAYDRCDNCGLVNWGIMGFD